VADPLYENAEIKKQKRLPERLGEKGGLMSKKLLGLIVFLIFGLCAWAPWITQETATTLAETQFNNAWRGTIDGCGTSGDDLGARDFRKIPFGATMKLEYQCGLVMPGEPPLQTTVYITFFGTSFGYPAP
jgi:hypothetical protein